MTSTCELLEAALLRAAADLQAAEAAAVAAGDNDGGMPDFDAEDAAAEASEAAALATAEQEESSIAGGAPGAESEGVKTLAPAALVGEEGVEELLQELLQQEQGTDVDPVMEAPAGQANPAVAKDVATPSCSDSAAPTAAQASLMQPHHRLSLYTLSCRLELYVAEATWELLDRCALPGVLACAPSSGQPGASTELFQSWCSFAVILGMPCTLWCCGWRRNCWPSWLPPISAASWNTPCGCRYWLQRWH